MTSYPLKVKVQRIFFARLSRFHAHIPAPEAGLVALQGYPFA